MLEMNFKGIDRLRCTVTGHRHMLTDEVYGAVWYFHHVDV